MQLQQLAGFYWSARYNSFSLAARCLNVGQSAISHQVKALEAELGVKLYERVGKGIQLTENGKVLFEYAAAVIRKLDDLEAHFVELAHKGSRRSALAAYRGFMMYRLPQCVEEFQRRHPDVQVTIMNRILDSEILAMVLAGEIDFGITASWNDFAGMDFFEIARYDIFLCTAPGHRLAGRARVTLREIAQEPLILYERCNSIRRCIDEVFERAGLWPTVRIEAGGAEVIKEYVRRGLGVTIISGISLSVQDAQPLAMIPVTEYLGELGYGVAIRKGKYLSPVAKEFLRILGVERNLLAAF
ncbi:MAG: LysR family transcriptional regulator [bacterium]|jgi:DNA-binding transcriptional LysR family regulator|nr:LysR family transcriptional regulator [candidate division KSB1 bacterium]MDH7561076.1 LysR family transcriptional regulator [bacterium]